MYNYLGPAREHVLATSHPANPAATAVAHARGSLHSTQRPVEGKISFLPFPVPSPAAPPSSAPWPRSPISNMRALARHLGCARNPQCGHPTLRPSMSERHIPQLASPSKAPIPKCSAATPRVGRHSRPATTRRMWGGSAGPRQRAGRVPYESPFKI